MTTILKIMEQTIKLSDVAGNTSKCLINNNK